MKTHATSYPQHNSVYPEEEESDTCVPNGLPYGGKLWRWEMLANLANDRGFAKFIPAKFYPVK